MKKIVIGLLISLFGLSIQAQTDIKITPREHKVEKLPRQGLCTVVELDKKTVKSQWKKKLKEFGKVESSGSVMTVKVANVSSVSSNPVKVYGATESSGKGTLVWLAIDMGDKYVLEGGEGYSAASELLEEFAKSCYRSDLMEQVKEAEKALSSATKKQEKTIKQGEKLSSSFDSNADQKIKLEKELDNNAKQKVELEKDIVQNNKDKTASEKEVEKMKQALEIKKQELNDIK